MTTFALKIVTPDGVQFDGDARELVVRTTSGDVGILAGHINYVAPLGMGMATVITENENRRAACIGGMVSVAEGKVTLLPTTFEWSGEIDLQRANHSEERARSVLADKSASQRELVMAQARLKRALVRKGVANYK